METNIEIYEKHIRKTAQDGDTVFFSGNYWTSRMTRALTKSPWSHVGVLIWIKGRLCVLEALEFYGVRIYPMSRYVREYDGDIMFARDLRLVASDVPLALGKLIDLVGSEYDYAELARISWRIAMGHGYYTQDSKYICSELVRRFHVDAGAPINADEKGVLSPDTIAKQCSMVVLGRLPYRS